MAEADIIDGKAFAAELRGRIAGAVSELKADHGLTPGLAVVLVGEDPASQIYVRNKNKATVEAGMNGFEHVLPVDTGQEELLALIDTLNRDDAVHGILVQLPLPDQIDEQAVIDAISPEKDADSAIEESWLFSSVISLSILVLSTPGSVMRCVCVSMRGWARSTRRRGRAGLVLTEIL